MMRFLQFLNLAGVLALGVLCAAQWQDNRQCNQEINRLEAIRIDQSRKLDERDKTVAGQRNDLDALHEHFARLTGELKETEGNLALTRSEAGRLTAERDRLAESVEAWTAAVAERDARIQEANEGMRELAARLNDSIQKFNELATNHNDVVARYNELMQSRQQK